MKESKEISWGKSKGQKGECEETLEWYRSIYIYIERERERERWEHAFDYKSV